MKRIIISILLCVCYFSIANSQVVIEKFKFFNYDLYDFTKFGTEAKVKFTCDKTVKYLEIHYSGVNNVGDAICSNIRGGVNANAKHTKYIIGQATGPFTPGSKKHLYLKPSFYYGNRQITAFPRMIVLTYIGEEKKDTINLTKENFSQYFPKNKWIDVDYKSGFQPSN